MSKEVLWSYEHHYNSRSSAIRTKRGVFLGKIKHTKRWKGKQLAAVWFEGNKYHSKVPYEHLKFTGKEIKNFKPVKGVTIL